MNWLVVTDLDGSLLNHHNYSFEAALPALHQLKEKKIPVILNTSKTFQETLEIQADLELSAPFIVENGSCVYLPKHQFDMLPSEFAFSRGSYWGIKLGKSLAEISRFLDKAIQPADRFIRLTECSLEELQELTGLNRQQAEGARTREYSQPILWQGPASDLEDFKQRLHHNGLHTLQGGRFLHVQGYSNKGLAIQKLRTFYSHDMKTIVLGDSANDFDMLNQADIPVVVKSPGNSYLFARQSFPYVTKKEAPQGWAEGVFHALELTGG